MLPASNRGVGMNMGFPDVCNTPTPAGPVPIPYPNIGMNAQAAPFSPGVKICMVNALNMGSKIPMTSGDEAGSASPIKGPGAYTMGSPNVNIDGMPAITLTCPTTGNSMNNALGAVLVPSAVNVFFSYRAGGHAADPSRVDPYAREVREDDLAALGEAMRAAEPVRGAVLPGGVGYLAITLFTSDLPARAYSEIQRLSSLGMASLVIDLRGCPGGDADAALGFAEEFLDEGATLAIVVDGDGDEVVRRAYGGRAYAMPVVAVVDRGTASAAELFAGCLSAHGRAVLVGAKTYGKGSAQRVEPAAGGPGIVCATAARHRLPSGDEIEGRGITPDITVAAGGSEPPVDAAAALLDRADAALVAAWEEASSAAARPRDQSPVP